MSKIFDLANNLIKVSWSQIHVGQKKFLLKLYLGNLDLFEMMLFDIDDLQLFYLNQNSNEIEKQLKLSFRKINISLASLIARIKSRDENLEKNLAKNLSNFIKIVIHGKLKRYLEKESYNLHYLFDGSGKKEEMAR
ncbi:hypothetical protein BpHYR1_006294 [Brachionus plicatilis]|uniref:Uncharacterized protein n=1 Tax=Brachionus plicatilis TaxID=10195 RepID=A0A3M7QTT9_BRAPC|nr:hypothetical protein BpHYR1_006294 [Brachionus plicatilis]